VASHGTKLAGAWWTLAASAQIVRLVRNNTALLVQLGPTTAKTNSWAAVRSVGILAALSLMQASFCVYRQLWIPRRLPRFYVRELRLTPLCGIGTRALAKKSGIVGLGGLGHMGVKLARALGAHVVLFTTSESKVEDGFRLGAHEVILSKNAKELKKHRGSFDFILDTVSAGHDVNAYLESRK
jgi:Zinc-binding dehydrogenase